MQNLGFKTNYRILEIKSAHIVVLNIPSTGLAFDKLNIMIMSIYEIYLHYSKYNAKYNHKTAASNSTGNRANETFRTRLHQICKQQDHGNSIYPYKP